MSKKNNHKKIAGFHHSQSKELCSLTIAAWKNNAGGAYTIMHDDFGIADSFGIMKYADKELHKRGLTCSFGVIVGNCIDHEEKWKDMRLLESHGHELVNHSWNHNHGIPDFYKWDKDGKYWGKDEFEREMLESKQVIEENLAEQKVTFYTFPYDECEHDKLDYLRSHGYLGARGAIDELGGVGINHYDYEDDFQVRFLPYFPEDKQQFGLNEFIEEIIKNNYWGVREFHGVQDDSWGTVPLVEYQEHLDYLQKKVKQDRLWVAPPSVIIRYRNLKKLLAVREISEAGNKTVIAFDRRNGDLGKYETELTFLLELGPGVRSEELVIMQNDRVVKFSRFGEGVVQFDLNPLAGDLVVCVNGDYR